MIFPRPVYWTHPRQAGQPAVEQTPEYGRVYHVGSEAEELEMLRAEQGLMWQAHPRTKGSAGYPDAVREVAREENCALIDLNAMSKIFYKALGEDLGKAFQDGTHHNNYGSYELAKCVVHGIKQSKLPLAKFIVKDFGDFDPAKPDPVATFEMPASPSVSSTKPLGN